MSVASAEILLMLMPLAAVTAILLGRQQQRLAALKRENASLGRVARDLEAVFERAPLGLGVFNRELRYVRINQLLADINGAAIEEHIGKTIDEMVPDIAEDATARLRGVLHSGMPRTGTVFSGTTAANPGILRTWRESLFPLLDRTHEALGVMVAVEEISEQQRLDDALHQSRQREQRRARELDCLLHVAPAGLVIAADRACQRVKANAAAQRLLRLDPGESASLSAPGAPSFTLVADGRPLAPDELPLQRAAAHGDQTWGAHLTVRFAAGDEMRIIVNALPLRDEHGELIGAVAGFIDAGAGTAAAPDEPPAAGAAVPSMSR